MKHEDFVSKDILCGKNWEKSEETRNAAVGMAIVCAFLQGVKPTISEMSKYLKIPEQKVNQPFRRLLFSGIFSKEFNARSDQELLGSGINSTNDCLNSVPSGDVVRNAWCNIGAIASGLIYRQYSSINFGE